MQQWDTSLMGLKVEDFLAPNPVLCYGAGAMFRAVAPELVRCGINLVGVIDRNMRGEITVCSLGRDILFHVYSVKDALQRFGKNTNIIVTIGKQKVLTEAITELVSQGFMPQRIFDPNVYTWLMIPSAKSYCLHLGRDIAYFGTFVGTCCPPNETGPSKCEWLIEGRDGKEIAENVLQKWAYYRSQSREGKIPLFCQNCEMLTNSDAMIEDTILAISLSDHSYCNADCVYCGEGCSKPVNKAGVERSGMIAEFFEKAVKTLHEKKVEWAHDAYIGLVSGEITIHPHKHRLYDVVKKYASSLSIPILTNGFLYDQEISDIIAGNKRAYVQCDLDSGTSETYVAVKGFNKFDVVKRNLKEYAKHGKVIVKYIVLPGLNDNESDILGSIKLLKELGLKSIVLSPDFKHFNDKMEKRKTMYFVMKFIKELKNNDLVGELPSFAWKNEDKKVLDRMTKEFLSIQM